MIQKPLPFEEEPVDHDVLLMRAVRNAVTAIGVEKFAEFAGADDGDISRALNGKRVWQQRWTNTLLDLPILPLRHKQAIVDAIGRRAGLTSAPFEPRTATDIAKSAIAALRRFGEMGADFAEQLEVELLTAVKEGRR